MTLADRLFYTYNGRDCCCTYECNAAMDKRLMPGQRRHYEFNVQLLAPLLYMELRGIRYDYEKAKAKLKRVQRWAFVLQDIINRAAGRTLPPAPGQACHGRKAVSGQGQGSLDQAEGEPGVCEAEPADQGASGAGPGEVDTTRGTGPNSGIRLNGGSAGAQPSEVDTATAAWVALIREQLCLAKPRRREQVTTTRTFKNGRTKTTTKTVSTLVEVRTLADCRAFVLASKAAEMRRVLALLSNGTWSAARRGELSTLLGTHVKVNATGAQGDAVTFLYQTCGFPRQFQKEGNRLTERLASDDEALIKIWVGEQKKPVAWTGSGVRLKNRGRLALAFLKLRRLITQTKTLRVAPDPDGRMRCGYNVVGTETARLTCYESPTGSGFNLQTVTKSHRNLFVADEGCLLAQCDLSGADGWTVAAYAAAQGDRTMLEDYRAGIKPAKVGVLMWQQGAAINRLSREALKEACKAVSGESWQYFAFKKVQHGSSYKMGKFTMSDGILIDSWKLSGTPVVVSAATCEQMQKTCFFTRYWGIPRVHAWMADEIKRTGCLIASNGFKRLFFGRKDDHHTVQQALAHLPQVYTTYATLRALLNLWKDPDNRRVDEGMVIEPLHTVHDSLITQFEDSFQGWAQGKLHEWFYNELVIAQERLVIPFEGAVGRDWKNLEAF